MTLKKCLTVILLSCFFLSSLGSLEVEKVESEDGNFSTYLLTGPELPVDLLFGLDRTTFEEIVADLKEKELLEEDYQASRTAFEECLSRIVEERKAAALAEESYRKKVIVWKLLTAIAFVSGLTIGLLK